MTCNPNHYRNLLLQNLDKYPNLNKQIVSSMKSEELCNHFYKNINKILNDGESIDSTIDPNNTDGFYLSKHKNMKDIITNIYTEIMNTLIRFIDYLVIPKRNNFYEITKDNVTDNNIIPLIKKRTINYILKYILPYNLIFSYDKMKVSDIAKDDIIPYETEKQGKKYYVSPKILFSNKQIYNNILSYNSEGIKIIKSIDGNGIIIEDDACELLREFLTRFISAILTLSSVTDKITDLEISVNKLQQSTSIIRGIDMEYSFKIRNSLLWIISSGTDWLEKREIDEYDIMFAYNQIMNLKKYVTFNKSDKSDKSDNELEIESWRKQLLENDLLISPDVLNKLIFIYHELNKLNIQDRINMFSMFD